MNREKMVELAKLAGFTGMTEHPVLTRFATLVAEAEQEKWKIASECASESLARIKQKCQLAERLWEVEELVDELQAAYRALNAALLREESDE